MNNIIAFAFKKEKEAKKFLNKSKKILIEGDFAELYDQYIEAVPGWRWFKSFLYIVTGFTIVCLLIRWWVFLFWKKMVVQTTVTEVVTGDIYNVTLDTKQIPAIGSLVWYYNNEIVPQSWAELMQIRIENDWVIKYNLCDTITELESRSCWEDCTEYFHPEYWNCFDTTIIASTEQWLKDALCD